MELEVDLGILVICGWCILWMVGHAVYAIFSTPKKTKLPEPLVFDTSYCVSKPRITTKDGMLFELSGLIIVKWDGIEKSSFMESPERVLQTFSAFCNEWSITQMADYVCTNNTACAAYAQTKFEKFFATHCPGYTLATINVRIMTTMSDVTYARMADFWGVRRNQALINDLWNKLPMEMKRNTLLAPENKELISSL